VTAAWIASFNNGTKCYSKGKKKMQWGAYSFYDWTDASKNTDKVKMIATKETYFIDI
jgi:hypothetical protein